MTRTRLAILAATLVLCASFPASAASQYPPSYRWRTVTTEHFYIHYHQGEEDLARRTAELAENIHTRVVPLMGWEPKDRTHVVLSDNIDASNGSATFFPNNRIEIFVSAPGADPSSPLEYYDNWLNLVLTHEYVHILHLDQAYGVAGMLRRIFGRNPLTFPNAYSPLWMIEGIATLMESEATDAGRLKGTFVDMVLRTSAIEKTWLSEPQASGLSAEWPGGSARYFYGSKFLQYVAQTEGMEQLEEYFHEYAASPIPFRVEGTAFNVFGRGFREMYEAWSEKAQADYLAEHRALAEEGLTPRERLTTLGFETKYSVISPDGRFLAYAHRGPYEAPTIRVFDITAGREIDSKRVNTLSHLSWSPDSKRLAYSQLEFKNTFSLLSDLYVWDVGARTARQMTSGKRLKDPAFTSDGQSLIAVENRAGRNRLVEVDLASGQINAIVSPDGFTQFSEPSVSPDGSRIAVAEWENGRIDVVLYDREGNRILNLTESLPRSTNASPRFSTDGRTLYFSGDVTGVANVFAVSIDGENLRRISNVYGGAFFPSTADGMTIYYTEYHGRGFDVSRFTAGSYFEIRDRVEPSSVIRRILSRQVELNDAKPPEAPKSPAEPLPVRDEPYRLSSSLRPRWWFPLLASSAAETIAGVETGGSDALGFHQYQAQVIASWGEDQDQYDYSLIYSYDRLYPTLTAAILQADNSISDLVLDNPAETNPLIRYYYQETRRRLVGLVTVPYRRYWWQSLITVGVVSDRYEEHLPFPVERDRLRDIGIFEGTLQGIRAGLAFQSARQFGYSVSPESGILATIDYEDLGESFGGDADVRQLRGDLRGYIPIPLRRAPLGRHVLALRAAGGFTEGDFLFQRELRLGGADVGQLLRLDTTHFPVRGFSSSELRGQNAAVGSIEYRFPLRQIERGPAVYPIYFQRILGDVFYDIGTVWNDDPVALPGLTRGASEAFEQGRTLASVGAEVALDLFFGYFVPVRYRVGVAYLLEGPQRSDVGSAQLYLTAGISF